MADTVFSKLRASAGDQDRSLQWYMRNVKTVVGSKLTPNQTLKSDIGTLVTNIDVGSMYLYFYDPKTKDTLDQPVL